MNTKVSTGTIARTVVLVVALANQVLTGMGKQVLPWSDNQVYDAVTTLFTIGAALAAWWKNNSFTKEAQKADVAMKKLKTEAAMNKLNSSNISIVEDEGNANMSEASEIPQTDMQSQTPVVPDVTQNAQNQPINTAQNVAPVQVPQQQVQQQVQPQQVVAPQQPQAPIQQ